MNHAAQLDSSRRGKILCVDDEPGIVRALDWLLRRNFEVLTATSGEAAISLIQQHDFDVIISDQRMPGMTGVELLDRLQVGHPELVDRVVFMTGGAFSPGAAELLARSARPRIDKPFDPDEVRRVLGAVAAAAGAE